MTTEEFTRRLRAASEHEVTQALNGAKVALPLTTEYEALEFFNCMLDVMPMSALTKRKLLRTV